MVSIFSKPTKREPEKKVVAEPERDAIPEGLDIAALKHWFAEEYSGKAIQHFLVVKSGEYSILKDGDDLDGGRIVVAS